MNTNMSESLPRYFRVGNYIIDKIIGKGGIGSVYLAHHSILNYPAAVKVHEYFPEDESVGRAFLESASLLSQLHHPNIIQLYDYGFVNNRAYMVMEYIDGNTLFNLIPNNQTQEWTARIILLFVQLLSAVRYAHNSIFIEPNGQKRRGIIHGDIKPQNIFINKNDNSLKLADFMIPDVQRYLNREAPRYVGFDELAKEGTNKNNLYDESIQLTPPLLLDDDATKDYGTPEYMPPEQVEGFLYETSDIFTLGATLYQLVTGLSPKSLLEGITPKKVNPFLPKWVEFVILRTMEQNPEDRFQSVAEIEAIFLESIHRMQSYSGNINELIMGDKLEIEISDITNPKGQMFIGKFNKVVADLGESRQYEIAEALKIIKEAIMSSQHLTQEAKQEYIEVVNQIGKEASKPKPNKTLLKALGEGLLLALKTVPDLIKAIAAVAPYLQK
jgi:serine/threonine protein kinase